MATPDNEDSASITIICNDPSCNICDQDIEVERSATPQSTQTLGFVPSQLSQVPPGQQPIWFFNPPQQQLPLPQPLIYCQPSINNPLFRTVPYMNCPQPFHQYRYPQYQSYPVMNWLGIANSGRVPPQAPYPQAPFVMPLSAQHAPPRANSTLSQPILPFTPIPAATPTQSPINGLPQINSLSGMTLVPRYSQQGTYCFPPPPPPPQPPMQFYFQPQSSNNGRVKKTVKKTTKKTRNRRKKEAARRTANNIKEVQRVKKEKGQEKIRKQQLGIKKESSLNRLEGESQSQRRRRENSAGPNDHLMPSESYSSGTINDQSRRALPEFQAAKNIPHPVAESPQQRQRQRNPDENGIDLYDIPEFVPGVSDYTGWKN